MAVVAISDSILTDIADAIRSKNGQETLYKPAQMPDAIEAISGGGITPTGTIEITQNGVVDVTNYASADVDVSGGITPTGTKQISITQNGTTTENVTNYANAEITVNVGNDNLVIPLDFFEWEVGAVNGTNSRSYAQNKTSNTARLRGVTLFQTYNLPLKLSANWGNGEWTIQYSPYNENLMCTGGFTPLTSDGVISESPYIAIVIRHTDGTTAMNISDINTIKPMLSLERGVV